MSIFNCFVQFPTLMLGAPLDETKKAKLNEAVGWFNSILKRVDAKKPFVTGSNFTIADIALLVTVSQLEAFGYDLSPYAAVLQWLKQSKSYMEKYDYEVKPSYSYCIKLCIIFLIQRNYNLLLFLGNKWQPGSGFGRHVRH